MIGVRECSKPGCSEPAVATLTYDYANSTAVLGPLATSAEPHAYDLCQHHAQALTVPRGWQVVRLQTSFDPAPPSEDDLLTLADAVREAAHSAPARFAPPGQRRPGAARANASGEEGAPPQTSEPEQASPLSPTSPYARRRAHFTVIPGQSGN